MGNAMSGLEAENSGGGGFRCGAATGPGQRLFGTARAPTTRGAHTQFALQRREVFAACANSALDVVVGDAMADANNH